jgi:hypothetical protein
LDQLCNASVLVYGPSKTGKTTFVCSGPGPTLLLDAEGGSRFLRRKKTVWQNPHLEPPEDDGSWEVCVCYVRDFGTLEAAFTWLHSGRHPFRTVAIDSISEAQQRCVDAIAGTKQMTTPDWGNLLRKISALVRGFRDLLIHPINPLDCVAFTAMDRPKDGVHAPYLQGAIADVLAYYLDIVVYYAVSVDEAGQPIRRMLTKPHPNFLAGDRPGMLPQVIDDPTLAAILELSCSFDGEMADAPQGAFPDLAAVAADDLGADRPTEEHGVGEPAGAEEDTEKETEA